MSDALTPMTAPELSREEREVVDRFEAAPCPWTGDFTHPLAHRDLVLHAGVEFLGYTDDGKDRRTTTDLGEAQVVTSRAPHLDQMTTIDEHFNVVPVEGGWHYPLIDLDLPAHIVPSSTPGHCHLYIDQAVRWSDYVRLLEAMRDCGLVEPGYVGASIERGHTSLRLPWVSKHHSTQRQPWPPLAPGEDPFSV